MDAPGRQHGCAGDLHCLTLDISRAVPRDDLAQPRRVSGAVTYVERELLLRAAAAEDLRRGTDSRRLAARRGWAAPIATRSGRLGHRPRPGRRRAGGARRAVHRARHCCTVVLVLRNDPARGAIARSCSTSGNYGYKLVDLDKRRPARALRVRRAVRLHVRRLRLLFGAARDHPVPGRTARRRHAQVPGGDPGERAAGRQGVLDEEAALDGTSTCARSSPSTSRTSTCSASRPRPSGRSTTRSRRAGATAARIPRHAGRPHFVAVLMRDLRKWGYLA